MIFLCDTVQLNEDNSEKFSALSVTASFLLTEQGALLSALSLLKNFNMLFNYLETYAT